MPVTVGLSAAVGAYLGSVGALGTLTALKGALLYGGLAGAQFLLRQQPKAPALQAARTQKTVQSATEPARTIYGRRRVAGAMLFYEANKAKIEGVMRPDGQNNATEIGKSRYWSFGLYLASHPCDGIDDLWMNGISQLLQPEGRLNRAIHRTAPDTFLRPLAAPDFSLDDADETSIIIPPRDGLWGIGHGHGREDYYRNDGSVPGRPDLSNERLSGTTRNLEWPRWPWMIHPRINGFGKPAWGGPRSGNGWWDYRKERVIPGDGQRNGPDEFAYLVADFYQNSREDEDVERSGYSWNSPVPQVEVLLRGKRIALPDETGGEKTPIWTENAAGIVYDYARTFLELPRQALDIPMFLDAIAICDEIIADQGKETDDPREISAIRTTERYHGVGAAVVSGDPADQVLRELAYCMDGAITTSGGRIAVQPSRLREVSHDIPAKDVFPGVRIEGQPRTEDRANRVDMRLTQSALHGWGPHQQAQAWNEAGERNDGGAHATDMGSREYMTSPVRAGLLMEAELLRIRVEGGLRMAPVYTFQCTSGENDEHLTIRELDRITFSHAPMGLSNVEIEVLSVEVTGWVMTIVGRGNASIAPALAPIYCPGFGDAPPPYPSEARGHVGTLYLAPSTVIPTIRPGRA